MIRLLLFCQLLGLGPAAGLWWAGQQPIPEPPAHVWQPAAASEGLGMDFWP